MVKACNRCKIAQDAEQFHKNCKREDGLDPQCKLCKKSRGKAYRQNNKNATDRVALKEKQCGSCKIVLCIDNFGKCPTTKNGYRSQCKSCRSLKLKDRWQHDTHFKEKEMDRLAIVYLENKEKILERCAIWSKNNPDKKLEHTNRRRAAKAKVSFEKIDSQEIKNKSDNKCFYCECIAEKYHFDHVQPLCKGGDHVNKNLVLACVNCNCSKQSRTLNQWYDSIDRLSSKITDKSIIEKHLIIKKNILKLINEDKQS